jgi:hypothetical protein
VFRIYRNEFFLLSAEYVNVKVNEVSGSCGSNYEDYDLLRCDAMYSLVDRSRYQHFGGTVASFRLEEAELKMEAAGFSETFVFIQNNYTASHSR